MKIKFLGAAREVTGSKHLITTKGTRILLDCGMYQGKGLETDAMNRDLGFDPATVDYLLLSHAHIDHSGLIPYMYKQGFRGKVICTNATRDLCAIMLQDTAFIQASDVKWFNQKRQRQGLPPVKPIYTQADVEGCMTLFIGVPHDRTINLKSNIKVTFTHTGHMLGGGVVNLEIEENGKTTTIAYTGDIGRRHNKIVHLPEAFPQCDYLITESTYGDRLHASEEDAQEELLKVITHTCVNQRGKLIIPSFAVGRTQEIAYILNKLFEAGRLPKINIFIDSPLSVNATEIFRMHIECMNDDIKEMLKTTSDPFGFNSLHYIKDIADSKRLNFYDQPCVIISASGMMEAGRVKHHVANSVSNPRNTILIVGYCTPTSLGARIQEPGLKEISIFGEMHPVRAHIAKIESLSGHGDYEEMLAFLACQNKSQVRTTFVVHGEYDTQLVYKDRLYSNGFKHIEIPEKGDTFELL